MSEQLVVGFGWIAAGRATIKPEESVVEFGDLCSHAHVTSEEAQGCGGTERPHIFHIGHPEIMQYANRFLLEEPAAV